VKLSLKYTHLYVLFDEKCSFFEIILGPKLFRGLGRGWRHCLLKHEISLGAKIISFYRRTQEAKKSGGTKKAHPKATVITQRRICKRLDMMVDPEISGNRALAIEPSRRRLNWLLF
jgi:hypothetical protein